MREGAYPRSKQGVPAAAACLRVEENVFVGMTRPSVFDFLAPDPEDEERKTWREVRNGFERMLMQNEKLQAAL